MFFLRLKSKNQFQRITGKLGNLQAVRWRPDGHPCTFLASINPEMEKWLESHMQGRWYFVINRHKTSFEEITTTRKEVEEYRLARRDGRVTKEMTDRFSSFPEIAFELRSDMLIFKLVWGGS